jgi:hypothetical protein
LYCYLDPDMLGPPTPARIRYLGQVARRLNPFHNLRSFCRGLHLIAPEMSNVLPLLQKKDNWFDSTTSALPFRAHLESLGFHMREPCGVLHHLFLPECFSCLHLAIQAYLKFWDPFMSYPGRDPLDQTIAQFARMHGGSGALCIAISRVLRPSGAKRGRPRKLLLPGTLQDALGPRGLEHLWSLCDRTTT